MSGGVTPPFGSMMFIVCSILKVRLIDFVHEVMPLLFALFIVLMILLASMFQLHLLLFLLNLIKSVTKR